MMHSKGDVWIAGRKQTRPEHLHAPLQSPVKKDSSRLRLVNKLDHHKEDGEDSNKREKLNDSGGYVEKEVEGETQDGRRVNENVNQSKESYSYEKRLKSKNNPATKGKPKDSNRKEPKGLVENDIKKQETPKIHYLGSLAEVNEKVSLSNNRMKSPKVTRLNKNTDFPVGDYNILLTLVKMSPSSSLAQSMKKFLKSVCRYSSVKLTLHAVVDDLGKIVLEEFFKGVTGLCKETHIVVHDVNHVIEQLKSLTKVLQLYFSSDKSSYYNDPIFFMSTALHKVFPPKLKQIIMMDVDLRFVTDIKPLFEMFNEFKETNIMGLVREQSPVYRHIFYNYRNANKNTKVGDPPPDGISGFNSGVVLFHLENMRKSTTYNSFLGGKKIESLSKKYQFHGHLGDQDFFTLLSVEYPEMFYHVPCSWNRQLCTWWRDNGYFEVFDLYFNCTEPIHVYHGNCRTPIPVDQEEI